MKIRMITFIIILAITVTCYSVRADGESRQATKEEQDYTLTVYRTIANALPGMPAQWRITDKTETVADSFVGVGVENQPMSLDFTLAAEDSARLAESEQQMSQVMEDYAMSHQDETQQMMDDISPKIEALSKQMEEAIAKGDMDQLEKIQNELLSVQAPMAEKSDAMQQNIDQQTEEYKAKDARVWILVNINSEFEDVDGYEKQNPISGHPAFWRTFAQDDFSDYEGEMLTFVGAWKLRQEGEEQYMATTWNLGLPHTVVQNMVVRVQGDKSRARKIIESVNWEMLNQLFNAKQ